MAAKKTNKRDSKTERGAGSESGGALGSAWERAKFTDSTVAKMLEAGAGLESIIAQLVAEKEWGFKRIIALESIAPRKIRLPDGMVMVWHCPDDLIPDSPNDGGERQP